MDLLTEYEAILKKDNKGYVKMSLKEKAVDAYKRKAEQERKENLKDAEFSAVAAEKILKERIGEGFNIQIISKEPNATVFDVDGIKFVVGIGDSICIIRKCEKCETEYSEYVPPNFGDREKFFRDIGKIIVEPHNDYDCQRILEERCEKKEQTTEERLLDALKCFIQENTGEFVG